MFDLVTDVTDYPNFLPWCRGVTIRWQNETEMEAQMDIHFKGLRQHVSTRNLQRRPTHIDINFTEGPFKKFTGYWRFMPLREQACQIEFSLHYELANTILGKIMGPLFSHMAHTFVASFIKRAKERYGQPHII